MNIIYDQIYDLINMLEEANDFLSNANKKEFEENLFLFLDIHDALVNINKQLFNSEYISNNCAAEKAKQVENGTASMEDFLFQYNLWKKIIVSSLQQFENANNHIDIEFYTTINYLKYNHYDTIFNKAVKNLKEIKIKENELCYEYEAFYALYRGFYGAILVEQGYYKLLENRISILKEHLEDFVWLYEELSDYRSKKVLCGIMNNWLTFNHNLLFDMKEYNYKDYFDLDLIKCDKDEVFVDLGAYTGDSSNEYIKAFGKYKKIYCYEITPESMEKMKKKLLNYPNIEFRNKAVGSSNSVMYLNRIGKTGAANQVKKDGEQPVEVVTIDQDIKEKVSFIKMDIEGAEYEALQGCVEHITKDHPKLAISTYHNNEDIYKIPKMIKEMSSKYKLYMRYNGNLKGPTDYVLFAL